jgi:energy-coupling factor transport system ATP-binding protein
MTVLMVEHRVEDVLRIQPERVMFMSQGEIRYLGNLSGLSKVVNYREVKLPAAEIVERAGAGPFRECLLWL